MSFSETLLGLLVALAAGVLIGLERQQSQARSKHVKFGGVRTFPLLALTGALAACCTPALGPWPVFGALLAVGSFLALSYYQEWRLDKAVGITTAMAALITFLLGVLALLPNQLLPAGQRHLLVIACAGTVMALLSFKDPLHRVIRRISQQELYATAKFVILALVLLPLLPDRTIDPLQALNPFNIGLMVVLIAGINFVGYVATRVAGPASGLAVTGLLGGLASSTAVTLCMAAMAGEAAAAVPLAAVAIVTASSTMFVRILGVIGVSDYRLFFPLLGPLVAMTLAGYATALLLYLRARRDRFEARGLALSNPFALASALKFGLVFAVILLLSKAAQSYLGEQGLYASSVLAGLVDVDAITLSVAHMHRQGLATGPAAAAIILAAATNSAVKAAMAAWIGGRGLGGRVALALAVAVGAGMVVLALGKAW